MTTPSQIPPDPNQSIPIAAHAPPRPLRTITATTWMIVAGSCFGSCLLCTCGVGMIAYFKPFGNIGGGAGSDVVGKWEAPGGGFLAYEFKKDGTGSMEVQAFKINGKPNKPTDFKWSVDNSKKKPVLLIDDLRGHSLTSKTHYHFVREADVLTLIFLGGEDKHGVLVHGGKQELVLRKVR